METKKKTNMEPDKRKCWRDKVVRDVWPPFPTRLTRRRNDKPSRSDHMALAFAMPDQVILRGREDRRADTTAKGPDTPPSPSQPRMPRTSASSRGVGAQRPKVQGENACPPRALGHHAGVYLCRFAAGPQQPRRGRQMRALMMGNELDG